MRLEDPICLVLKHPERLSRLFLQVMLNLDHKCLKIIFIAHSPTAWIPDNATAPISMHFEAYSVEDVVSILERQLLPFNDHDGVSKDFLKSETRLLALYCGIYFQVWYRH